MHKTINTSPRKIAKWSSLSISVYDKVQIFCDVLSLHLQVEGGWPGVKSEFSVGCSATQDLLEEGMGPWNKAFHHLLQLLVSFGKLRVGYAGRDGWGESELLEEALKVFEFELCFELLEQEQKDESSGIPHARHYLLNVGLHVVL